MQRAYPSEEEWRLRRKRGTVQTRLALVLSCVALTVALLGSTPLGGAALDLALPANSVGTTQVRNHSLLASDFKKGQLPRGEQGPPGTIEGVVASGDLTGAYPGPEIGIDAVTGTEVADGSLLLSDTAALSGQVRVNAPSVPATSCLALYAPVPGVKPYDRGLVLPTQNLPAGLFVTPIFNTNIAGRILFRVCNATSKAADPPLGGWAYVVWRA
jgi:hypothetical protein